MLAACWWYTSCGCLAQFADTVQPATVRTLATIVRLPSIPSVTTSAIALSSPGSIVEHELLYLLEGFNLPLRNE